MPLPKLDGRQKDVLYLEPNGQIVVLGTAGSGKTTMAIYRAAYLAKHHTDDSRRLLLVTFNRTLVLYLKTSGAGLLPPSVDVCTYHKFALGYLKAVRGQDIYITSTDTRLSLIQKAVEESIQHLGNCNVYQQPLEMLSTEFEWIGKIGIQTEADYINFERIGRKGTIIDKNDRHPLYYAYQKYIELRTDLGYHGDYNDIASLVLSEVKRNPSSGYYQHIIIDEGQDFSPEMLRSLASATPEDGNLMFFGDVAQQIYGTRISWRDAGFTKARLWYFRENYRNTPQIVQLAFAITNMPYYVGEEDLVAPRETQADGPLPALIEFSNKDQEVRFIIDRSAQMGRTQTVAILMRTRDDETQISQLLSKKGISPTRLHREMNSWSLSPGVFYGTYHSAKGLEFDTVIMPFCSDDVIPSPERFVELGNAEDTLAEEGRLLYVAVTRAKKTVIITYSGQKTRLLPENDALYQVARM
jgi:superfamily I DNA/RNA helicase